MTKTFCDKCGELVSQGNTSRGISTKVRDDKNKRDWVVRLTVEIYAGELLCRYCAHDLLEFAYDSFRKSREELEEKKVE